MRSPFSGLYQLSRSIIQLVDKVNYFCGMKKDNIVRKRGGNERMNTNIDLTSTCLETEYLILGSWREDDFGLIFLLKR